jgi:hypothetical protein
MRNATGAASLDTSVNDDSIDDAFDGKWALEGYTRNLVEITPRSSRELAVQILAPLVMRLGRLTSAAKRCYLARTTELEAAEVRYSWADRRKCACPAASRPFQFTSNP